MEILSALGIFIVGLVLLLYSSGWLVQGSVKLSFLAKLTPLFVGSVLIAFGTSAPEAGIGIMAAIRDHKSIALGNVIGSNIANIGLILGLCSLFRPIAIDKAVFKREIPIMLFAVILVYWLSFDLVIGRIDGVILIVFFLVFCFLSYRGAKLNFDENEIKDFELKRVFKKRDSKFLAFFIIVLALAGVVFGADLMVRSGVKLANIFGVSPWIIGITIFALGSSLPELATSLVAVVKRVSSISVGNIIGSNIFNILFVLGIVALIRPVTLNPRVLKFEFPALLIFSFVCFTALRTGYKISRREGLVLFLGYIAFIVILLKQSVID